MSSFSSGKMFRFENQDDSLFINSEALISNVKENQVLYDVNLPEYRDRVKKMQAWEKVCRNIFPQWDSLSLQDRAIYERETQKRWRSVRDAFVKSYKKMKFCEYRGIPHRGKRYCFFNQLSFLLPYIVSEKSHIDHRIEPNYLATIKIEGGDNFNWSDEDSSRLSGPTEDPLEDPNGVSGGGGGLSVNDGGGLVQQPPPSTSPSRHRDRSSSRDRQEASPGAGAAAAVVVTTADDEEPNHLPLVTTSWSPPLLPPPTTVREPMKHLHHHRLRQQNLYHSAGPSTSHSLIPEISIGAAQVDVDEDRLFLLSLVSWFKKLSDDDKLSARIEILELIREKLKKPDENSVSES